MMMKSFCFALVSGVVALSALAGGENTPRKAWALDADCRKLLDEWKREGAAYRPHSDHVGLFARGQLKYGGNRTDFIHQWYERPLYQDSSWRTEQDRDVLINPFAWKKTAEMVRAAKMDGLAACPTQSGRHWLIPRSVEPGGEMTAFLELPYGYHEGEIEKYLKVAEMALKMPNGYRIDGKVVLTRYPTVREAELEKAEAFRKALEAKFGPDKFIVLYYVTAFEGKLPDGPMTVTALQEARAHLRRVLRKTDGIFYAGWEVYWPRRYGLTFETEVIVPMIRAVLAEPEFAGRKYLGMPMCQGHANCYRWCYSLDSNATQIFVDRMRAMEALRPDFILACEWDEQNENTHFRPTVSCGHTNLRIMRYWADRFAGRAPDPWPYDDAAAQQIPNLILSYRKSLVVGEPIEVEVLNIPDGTFSNETFSVSFAWKAARSLERADIHVRAYSPQTLPANDLAAIRFVSPASELAAERALVPELTVTTSSGRTFPFSDGLWPLDIHATRQVDTWWVKTPVREIGKTEGALTCSGPDATGVYTISGRVKGTEPFDSVEVLEGPDTVYMVDREHPDNLNVERFVIDVQGHAVAAASHKLNGTIRIRGAKNLKLSQPWKRYFDTQEDGWVFKNVALCNWPTVLWLELPSDQVGNVVVDLQVGDYFRGEIKLADVIAKDVVGLNSVAGGCLTVRRDLRTQSIPVHVDAAEATFSFRMKPLDANAVLRLQTVDRRKYVWRSQPYMFFRKPAGKQVTYTVFERDEERVGKVTLDASLVPSEIRYEVSPSRGSAVAAEGLDRAYWGVLGGYLPQVNGIGRGESSYGNAPEPHIQTTVPDWEDSAPTYFREPDGSYSVQFKGAEYATFPQQLCSMFAGWEVEVDVWPDTLAGTQAIFGSSAVGCNVAMADGVVKASYFDAIRYAGQYGAVQTAKGPSLVAGRWNRVKVSYDVNTLTVSVDGRSGEPLKLSTYMHQQRYTTVGAENHALQFFRGRMRNLAVRVR